MYFLSSNHSRCIMLMLAFLITFGISGQVRSGTNNRVGTVSREGGAVTVNLNVLPPYSPFYRDYAGYNGNKTIVTLLYQNFTSGTPLQVYLSGSIRKDDNSIVVQVKDSYRPGIPITLTPNMPQTLTGAQLRTMFGNGSTGDLVLTGITSREIVMNQALPEGNYTVCVQVKNYSTGQVISEDCRTVFVTYSEPPQIFSPLNNGAVMATDPQYVLTSWSPVTPFVQGVSYRLRIAKLLPGVSPLDALYYSTQVVVEKSNLPTSNYAIDLASGIKLDTGSMYVMQVTATSPLAYIKNNGQSEPVVFYYKGNKPVISTATATAQFTFLNPRDLGNNKPDTLKVNADKTLLINWGWLKEFKKDSSQLVDVEQIKTLNLQQYKLSIFKIADNSVLLERTFERNSADSIKSFLQMSQSEAENSGFVDGEKYRATLIAIDKNGATYNTYASNNFIYRKISNDTEMYAVKVRGVINYGFKGFPEIYPAQNTEIVIDALTLKSAPGVIPFSGLEKYSSLLPAEKIRKDNYIKIASTTVTTNENGAFSNAIQIPKGYFDRDTIYYRLKIGNTYYVDTDFKLLGIPGSKKDSVAVDFGQQLAKTYAYRLKLKVKKNFTSYNLTKNENGFSVKLDKGEQVFAGSNNQVDDTKQTHTYTVEGSAPVVDIPVVLYREGKQEHIPYFEGDINQDNSKKEKIDSKLYTGGKEITIVAVGITHLEGNDTYAVFDKLLATNLQDEEYKILAIKDLDKWKADQQGTQKTATVANQGVVSGTLTSKKNVKVTSGNVKSAQYALSSGGGNVSQADFSAIKNAVNFFTTNNGSGSTNFVDSTNFVAEVKSYHLPLPALHTGDDDYYRTVEDNYDIISCKPPTSVFKGRLSYIWKSNSGVKRPLANTHFRVMVDYVDATNKSIGSIYNSGGPFVNPYGHSQSVTFFPDNQSSSSNGVSLIDQYATMAEGTTDENGNFSVETVNFDFKGDLGSGTLRYSESNSKPPVTGQTAEDKLKEIIAGGGVINPSDGYGWIFSSLGNISNTGNQSSVETQGNINHGFSVGFDAGLGSFELGKAGFGGAKGYTGAGVAKSVSYFVEDYAHGPNPSPYPEYNAPAGDDAGNKAVHYAKFSRTFRIVIDGDAAGYYYPSKDVVVIQPFENCVTPKEITHYVREFELHTYTKERGDKNALISLSDMQVTLFRGSKPQNLPQGEGDGKYAYKALINPEYNTNAGAASLTSDVNASGIFSKKFEQLWSEVPTQKPGEFAKMKGLLQAQKDNYFIEASSFVDKTSKTYQATIDDLPAGEFDIASIDWTNPETPVVDGNIELKPLTSRALITVRDVVSAKPLSSNYNARVIISTNSTKPSQLFLSLGAYPTVPVDKYGYAEILATQSPLNSWVPEGKNPTDIYFFATAKGYKISDGKYKAAFVKQGYQAKFDIGLSPGGVIKGKVISYDNKTGNSSGNPYTLVTAKPVPAYLQVDSGNVFETKPDGNFEINVPLIEKSRLKIIPKDVAYFDTAYVMTDADSKKEELNLKSILLSRRKHRIQFFVSQKMAGNQYGPPTPISGAIIQLGETVKQTANNGSVKFEFENVSVNNYTFVVRGPAGSNYIPKSINVPSEESKEYKTQNVVLEKGSEVNGVVTLDNVPVKHARVYIDVSNTSSNYGSINTMSYLNTQHSSSDQGSQNSVASAQNISLQTQHTAEVFGNAPSGSITDQANLVVAYSDNAGKYTLRGVPVDNQKINIRATLDTTFTVSGDLQPADIKNGKALTNLNLTGFNGAVINKIYGFPLTVEKITPVNNQQVKVSGLVHWTEAISDFTLKEADKAVRIEETLFDLVDKNGSRVGVANSDEVKLSGINSLKLSYLDKYNVQLMNANGGTIFNSTPLKLRRENDYGKISGKMQIVDNSFNYPSSYLNFDKSQFYLAKTNADHTINNIVDVVSSAKSETESANAQYASMTAYRQAIGQIVNNHRQDQSLFNLCNGNAGAIQFKLIRFNATANPLKSYIDQSGKIHLNVDLSCHVPNAQPEDLSLNIPDMVLDENKVYRATNSDPIKIKLEDWTLDVKNWSFSVEEGGILSNDALIRTSLIDIPVKKFVLRSDMFLMDSLQLNNLTLAGGLFKLDINQGIHPKLNYEYKVGSDMMPHWNFCMISNGNNKVATLQDLAGFYRPDLTSKYPVEFNYIQLLSDNSMLVQLKQNDDKARLIGNKLASFEPLSIYSGPNYISMNGLLNVGAPRMSDIPLNVVWSSPLKNPDFEKVSTDFEGKGFVHFIANKNNIAITNQLITIEGKVVEQPSKTFNPIPSTFYARCNASPTYEVVMQKDWITQLTEDEPDGAPKPATSSKGYNLKLTNGGMTVESGDWSTCKFSGSMRNNKAQGTDDSDNIADCTTSFEVLGDISASSSGVAVKGISTPFGSMSQSFDFAKKQLIGSLTINAETLIGTMKLHSGTIETCFDPDGFYVAGGCYAFIPAGLFTGDYNTGFMVGTYPLTDHLWNVTNSYIDQSVVNACYKSTTSRLSGIYSAFNRELFNVSCSQNYILASGYVKALGLIGGDAYLNVSNGWKVGLGGYVHIGVAAGLSAITGTSISGSLSGDSKMNIEVGSGGASANVKLKLDFAAHIEQSLLVTTISKDISVSCSASIGSSAPSFSLSSGDTDREDCK